MWKIIYTKDAQKDAIKIENAGLKNKACQILKLLSEDPFSNNPPFGKLKGDLSGAYSRRINIKHRIVYQVYKEEKIVKILRMWTHYE
jgi:Txe/YoeB family toxin of toxin-antitoxin system